MLLKNPCACIGATLLLLAGSLGLGCAGGSSASSAASSGSTTTTIPSVAPGRGIWFWESQAQQAIVAGTSSQDAAIANLKSWGVTSVYGSYSAQISTVPAAVRAWNSKLAANGIASYSLLSTGNAFLPEQWSTTQTWLQSNFLAFNAAAQPAERFVGVAFDVEPHAYTGDSTHTSWAAATPALRRVYMNSFLNMFLSARALLNANGASSATMQTYIVNWFQNLNSTIGWTDINDRNAWFTQLSQTLDRVTVDEYGTSNATTIATSFAVTNALLNSKGRPALESSDTAWSSRTAFFSGATATESQTATFIDIEDYDTTVQ